MFKEGVIKFNMGSINNTWREPIGYTSSFRPVRTPLRLNYGRDDAKIKEKRGQKFQKQNYRGRESTPRTFPMELRPREVIIPEVASSKYSNYCRSRSTPREGPREVIIPEVASSKYSNYSRSRSTPRKGPRDVIIPEVASSKYSNYSCSRSTPREGKNNSNKTTSTSRRTPPGYVHSSLSTPNRAPPGYIHASTSAPIRASSGSRYSSPQYREEIHQRAPRRKSLMRESPLKKGTNSGGLKYERRPEKRNSLSAFNSRYYCNSDTSRRFLRSHSEPPRRSARIANLLKKSAAHEGLKNEPRNSAKPRARSKVVSRASGSSPRDRRSASTKYKTSRYNSRSPSVAPSRYSSSCNVISNRELENRGTEKGKTSPHRPITSHDHSSSASSNEKNNEVQCEYDQSNGWSSSGISNGFPAIAERSFENPNISIEDTDPSNQEDVKNDVDIDNRLKDVYSDYKRQSYENPGGMIADYINNESLLYSRREPSNYVNDTYRNNGYLSSIGPTTNFLACQDNTRQGVDSLVPFHRRQMDAHETSSNITERVLMQNNFWNNNVFSSTQIICPDGGVLCINENIYCLNSRVSLNNDHRT